MAEGGRWTVDGGRWTVDGGRWTVDGGRWTVDGGRWTADGGRRAAGGGRRAASGPGRGEPITGVARDLSTNEQCATSTKRAGSSSGSNGSVPEHRGRADTASANDSQDGNDACSDVRSNVSCSVNASARVSVSDTRRVEVRGGTAPRPVEAVPVPGAQAEAQT